MGKDVIVVSQTMGQGRRTIGDAVSVAPVGALIVVGPGRYRDNLDRTFPLADIADAHRYMEDNRAAGKVVGLPA